MGRPTVTKESFWNRVNRGAEHECWNWAGPTSASARGGLSYGRIDAFGVVGVYVHRVAYWLTNPGDIELRRGAGLLVRHKCDNTICCNPNHLELGTDQDNVDDKVARGRQTRFTSTGSPNAKLTAEDVIAIRAHRRNGVARGALALLYDVSVSSIKGVTSGRHYADI